MDRIERIIDKLNLMPHPEGGYFRETYRDALKLDKDSLGPEYTGDRNCATCIYFLLTSDSFSAFHKIRQDEIWHFYQGAPIRLHLISPQGEYSNVLIGSDMDQGQMPQFVVPKGFWFAGATVNDNDYSLLGCTVSPGFDFDDFELGRREELISSFPQHRELIVEFTRN